MTVPDRVRIAVLGAGPGGATVAALLAEQGFEVGVFERESFPRFHIGESLMTETWWIFERLGVLEQLRRSAFPRKYSVQFVGASGKASRPFYFREHNPHPSSVTWQVDRGEFDRMMLENARAKGADVHTGIEVREVLFDGPRAAGVRLRDASGSGRDVPCEVVVDATGLHALLGRQLRLLEPDPVLRKAAVFAHYEGAHRDAGIDEGATLIIHTPGHEGWFWSIPLAGDRTSIGVVGSSGEILKGRGTADEALESEIANCPAVRDRLASARRVSPVRVINDFSYRARRIAGDGWVLVGDAFGFIDPVYSTGVFLALKSGEMAADAIAEGLRRGDTSGRQLGRFGPEFNEGLEAMRKLVYAFYTPGFSFAEFARRYPQHQGRLVDMLTGNVFKPGVTDLFDELQEMCDLPRVRPLETPAA